MNTIKKAKRRQGSKGQAIIFIILVLSCLVFVVFWNYDLHRILHVKGIAQNAGDASAVMAARWQGISLNLMGDLNLMHALALVSDNQAAAETITNIQARLSYTGPMVAFMGSQQAAKQNRLFNQDDFTAYLKRHAQRVRFDYPHTTGSDGEPLFPEPYPNAWEEYASMLDALANDGIAAGPDNMRLYSDYSGGHILLNKAFYDAIAGRNWCWFYHNAPGLLELYQNFHPAWWPPLPPIENVPYINSEFFGLGMVKVTTSLDNLVTTETINTVTDRRTLQYQFTPEDLTNSATWYAYGGHLWSEWEAMSMQGDFPMPLAGPVKQEYDYAGADAAIRVRTRATRLTPGAGSRAITNTINWTAAAKPFGYLPGPQRPDAFDLVLPAFHQARLIPVDSLSGAGSGGYDLEWREHIEEHLPEYMEHGPLGHGCRFCRMLEIWENVDFRQTGVNWLEINSQQCVIVPPGPGGGGRGGRRRAH